MSSATALAFELPRPMHEVRALVRAYRHRSRVPIEADDLEQEVLTSLWRKSGTSSAYNPERGSFSNYVTIVARSAAANMLAARRWRPLPPAVVHDVAVTAAAAGDARVLDDLEVRHG